MKLEIDVQVYHHFDHVSRTLDDTIAELRDRLDELEAVSARLGDAAAAIDRINAATARIDRLDSPPPPTA